MDHQEQYLLSHRFRISEQSMVLVKTLRNELPGLHKEFKITEGMSFFGSRTKGFEKEFDQNKPDQLGSDLDLCVFYDGSVFGKEIRAGEPPPVETLVLDPATKDIKIDHRQAQHMADLTRARHQFEAQLQNRVKGRVNFLKDNKIDQEGKSVFIVDISEDATKRALGEFYESVKINDGQFSDENLKLLSRFFLGVGKGLYKNRKYIFDELKKREDGDKLLNILMQRLGSFERTRDDNPNKPNAYQIPFESYPKTIEEAEDFFLTEQY